MKDNKRYKDEEIQQIVEKSKSSTDNNILPQFNEDVELYGSIIDNLELEPSISIPVDFAKKTTDIAYRKKTIKSIIWRIKLYIIVSIPLVVLSLVVTYVIGPEIFWNVLEILSRDVVYFIFAGVLITIIQLLDSRLIKTRLNELSQ